MTMKNMRMRNDNPAKGFTMVELMISMALGLIVLAAMASLFKTGLNSTMLVTQRAETQQNMRAAAELMVKDLSMAGAGLPSGGIQLPTGAGAVASKFGCDQAGTCHITAFNYPSGNYMYGIIPGFLDGVEGGAAVPAAPAPAVNDAVTVAYCDYNFPLWEYNVTFSVANGGGVTLAVNAQYAANPPQAANAAGGLVQGDLVMLSNNVGTAVGEVTNVGPTSITFGNNDPLKINQSGAASNNITAIMGGANTVAYRLYVVTYYITVPGGGQTPRLMRQVNGLTPVPVADDIINLQVAYDTYNSTTNVLDANQANPIGVGESPNNIQKINLVIMGQSIINNGNKSQNLYLATDVSARNMAFRNRYQ
jgi:type IV pilus assembly protein PilW